MKAVQAEIVEQVLNVNRPFLFIYFYFIFFGWGVRMTSTLAYWVGFDDKIIQ
jgi:hypothetical protein